MIFSIFSSLKNPGSNEPILILSIPSIASISSIIVRRFTVPSKSSPYDAVCIPDKITSLNPLAANSFTYAITLLGSFEHTEPLA